MLVLTPSHLMEQRGPGLPEYEKVEFLLQPNTITPVSAKSAAEYEQQTSILSYIVNKLHIKTRSSQHCSILSGARISCFCHSNTTLRKILKYSHC